MNSRPADWNPTEFSDVERRFAQMAEVRGKCSVAWSSHHGGVHTVLGYDMLKAVASDPATFSNGGGPRFGKRLPPLEVDPPEHGVFRGLLQRFWLPSRIRAMEPLVREAAVSMTQRVVDAGHGDLAQAVAYPLPVHALCVLLGIDAAHWVPIKQWAEEQLAALSDDPEERAKARVAHEHLLDHARSIVRDRKNYPRDPDKDIASALLNARQAGEPLDEELIAGVLRILISAGHNSTTNALGNTFLFLAQHPEAQAALRADPGRIPTAIEELLRWESPVQELPRWATRNVDLNGHDVVEGERIAMLWGSGNRDPAAFDRPDDCLLDRKPNPHLAFGFGIHSCLGAPMARMELRVAVEELLARTRSFVVAGEVARKPYHHMGVANLPVTCESANNCVGLH